MSEIYKLRQRLSNIGKHTVEYKMTVAEARGLLSEIDKLTKPVEIKEEVVEVKTPTIIYKIMDGGSL